MLAVHSCNVDACNLNIKVLLLLYHHHLVSCITGLSSPSCAGWMKMLLWEHYLGGEKPWYTFSVDMETVNCLGGKQPQVVGMWMKDLEPFPKQAEILEHRISKVEELAEQACCVCVSWAWLSSCWPWVPAGKTHEDVCLETTSHFCIGSWPLSYSQWRWLSCPFLETENLGSDGESALAMWTSVLAGVKNNMSVRSSRAGLTGSPDQSSTQAWLKTYLWVPMNDICILFQKTFAIACNWQ